MFIKTQQSAYISNIVDSVSLVHVIKNNWGNKLNENIAILLAWHCVHMHIALPN